MIRRTTQVILWLLTAPMLVLIIGCGDDKGTEPEPTTAPVVTTVAVTRIAQTTAQCGGNVTADGGAAVTARGVCWSSNPTPTINDSKTTDGSGAGSFTSAINGLTAGSDYYVRTYATNGTRTGYGNTLSFTTSPTVTDIDGNLYKTVTIGSQVWMAENLKVTHYRNGDPIPNVTGNAWGSLTTGAYCNYNNDVNNVDTYGRLYDWFAVANSRNIAPAGWHVPTDEEWKQLEMYLGMSQATANSEGYRGMEAGKLKDTGTTHWHSPNTGASNESGFTALPGGYRTEHGDFGGMGGYAHFWSSTGHVGYNTLAWYRNLHWGLWQVYRSSFSKTCGYSVRCVRD